MAQLVVRNLNDDVKAKLQQRARQHARSTEEEVRKILRNAVWNETQETEPLGKRLGAFVQRNRTRGGRSRVAWSIGYAGHIFMILVDTNVLSAMIRVAAEPTVERWFDAQPPESVWTTITIFEIRFGLALLLPGRRRDRLYDAFDRAIQEILGGRVLPFDKTAAERAAAIAARQQLIGQPVETRDAQIAGIAAARKATLATRNIRHFENLGIILVDPWLGPTSSRPAADRLFATVLV
jgi:predicted nucleic acid-binding protein/plasmid stability protein